MYLDYFDTYLSGLYPPRANPGSSGGAIIITGKIGFLFLLLTAIACRSARSEFITPLELSDHAWHQVYADTSFVVSLDLAHVSGNPQKDSVAVWYETRHLAMREHEGKPWNREIIRSLLRCKPLSFKTVLTTIFLNNGPPVAQIGGVQADVGTKPWRPVLPNSVDEAAMRGACQVLQGNFRFPAN